MLSKDEILKIIDIEVGRKEDIVSEHYRLYVQGFIDGLRCVLNE